MKTALPICLLLALSSCTGCGATLTPAQVTDVTAGVDATICILNHITDPPATIALECLNDATLVTEVNKVLAAHRAAEAREQVPSSSDAGN